MNTPQTVLETIVQHQPNAAQMLVGVVDAVCDDSSVIISCPSLCSDPVTCDLLQTSESATLRPAVGESVLFWLPGDGEQRGVVLGRIGLSHAQPDADDDSDSDQQEQQPTDQTPDEVIIEAKNNLTLKCGEGSITMRKDGKILIKGKDLVSRAKRMNRIKGGAVSIN